MEWTYRKYWHFLTRLWSVWRLSLYQRRRMVGSFEMLGMAGWTMAVLCKVRRIENGWIYDKELGVSYELQTDIGQNLYLKGHFEQQEVDFLVKNIRAGTHEVILDIGANVGLHSVAFAEIGKDISVFSFEPSPTTRKILEYNLKMKKLLNCKVFPYALSNEPGKATFYQTSDNAYNSLKDTKRKTVVETVSVELTTIDLFISANRITKVDLIKIDVEGFEKQVLEGGLATFKKFKPNLFIEIYGGVDSNPDPSGTIELLQSIGYHAYVLVDGFKKPYLQHSDEHYNYWFSFN